MDYSRVAPARTRGALLCILAAGAMAAFALGFAFSASHSEAQAVRRFPVLVGAGDIASCLPADTGDTKTARLLDQIRGTVFTLGDNAYGQGSARQFANCYGPTWGQHRARTRPVAGNHEYRTPGASGYFDYFGKRAGKRGEGYYSYDRGSWHIVALNSNCEFVGCGPRSAQVRWLQRDLARNKSACTLAYWHHARFSSGSEHGSDPATATFWKILHRRNADVILSGHDHDYERFARQTPGGRLARGGIRQFVVGTGGKELRPFGRIRRNSQVRNATAPGVLKLTLRPKSYRWKFVPVAGKRFTDSGTTSCR